ncbi:MAG: heme-binding domain-containing protein [Flavobacteriales bacterium]
MTSKKMNSYVRRGLLVLGVVLVLSQFLQPDRTAPKDDPVLDVVSLTAASDTVADLLHAACYDCHGNTTTYPWYSYVTPVNFWLQQHVNEGREELNLSEWGSHKEKWQRHKAKEAVEMLEEGSMPPANYTWLHQEAVITSEERRVLIAFFQELRAE